MNSESDQSQLSFPAPGGEGFLAPDQFRLNPSTALPSGLKTFAIILSVFKIIPLSLAGLSILVIISKGPDDNFIPEFIYESDFIIFGGLLFSFVFLLTIGQIVGSVFNSREGLVAFASLLVGVDVLLFFVLFASLLISIESLFFALSLIGFILFGLITDPGAGSVTILFLLILVLVAQVSVLLWAVKVKKSPELAPSSFSFPQAGQGYPPPV